MPVEPLIEHIENGLNGSVTCGTAGNEEKGERPQTIFRVGSKLGEIVLFQLEVLWAAELVDQFGVEPGNIVPK